MASTLSIDINDIIDNSVNKAFCLEDTDKFPIKAYVPKLMEKITLSEPKEWNERLNTSFIKNNNFKISNSTVKLKNYININLDFDNLIFEDFEKGDNIEFKFKDKDIRTLYFMNRRSFDKVKDKLVLFTNDSSSYDNNDSRYSITLDSKNGNIEIKTSNKTFGGSKKSIILDQKNGTISLTNGLSGIVLDGNNVIIQGNLIYGGENNE